MRYKNGFAILNTQLTMGAIAEGDQPTIWPFQEGMLLVQLGHDGRHAMFGFLSTAAIRTMIQRGWLVKEGPYLLITETGKAAATRDFTGTFKLPRRRKSEADDQHPTFLTFAACVLIPGPNGTLPRVDVRPDLH